MNTHTQSRSLAAGLCAIALGVACVYTAISSVAIQGNLQAQSDSALQVFIAQSDAITYAPGETAHIRMLLTDERGMPACNARISHRQEHAINNCALNGEYQLSVPYGVASGAVIVTAHREGLPVMTGSVVLQQETGASLARLSRSGSMVVRAEAGGTIQIIVRPVTSFTGSVIEQIPADITVTEFEPHAQVDEGSITWHGRWEAGTTYVLSYRIEPLVNYPAVIRTGPVTITTLPSLESSSHSSTQSSYSSPETSSQSTAFSSVESAAASSSATSDEPVESSAASSETSASIELDVESSASSESAASSNASANTEQESSAGTISHIRRFVASLFGLSDTHASPEIIAMDEGRQWSILLLPAEDTAATAVPVPSVTSSVHSSALSMASIDPADIELTPLREQFDGNEHAVFRLMETDIPVPGEEGSIVDERDVAAVFMQQMLTDEVVESVIVESLITQQSAVIAEKILEDSVHAQDVRELLGEEAGSIKRDDQLQEVVVDALENKTIRREIASIAERDNGVMTAVEELKTDEIRDVIALAVAYNNDPAEAVHPLLDASGVAADALTDVVTSHNGGEDIVRAVAQSPRNADEGTDNLITVRLTDVHGRVFTPSYHFAKGSVLLVLHPERQFAPGVYTLTVTVTNPLTGESQTFEQDFAWGVLAFNPDKDTYNAGDRAHLAFGVLDDAGDIVCDATLTLDVTSPSGETIVLSTDDASIARSEVCGRKSSRMTSPDYEAFLTLAEEGEYAMILTANTANGTRTQHYTIEVGDAPFTVRRIAATRLYPLGWSPMTITVTFREQFQGVISDLLPAGFAVQNVSGDGIVEQATLPGGQSGSIMYWNASAAAGDTVTFTYDYDAPDISPQFYLVGPLNLDGESLRTEHRAWQIANDAVKTWDGEGSTNNCSEAANWNGNALPQTGDDIVFNGTSTKDFTWDAGCPSTIASLTMDTGYTGTGTIATTYTGALTITGNVELLGGMLTHRDNSTAETYRLRLNIGGNLTVGTGARINVNGLGYNANNGPGKPTVSSTSQGGGHGGVGGYTTNQTSATSTTYGSITHPTNLGSGSSWTADGGGAIYLAVSGSTIIHGRITANGTGGSGGGGAGGSVYLSTQTIAGAGMLTATGGTTTSFRGSGGGGRVSVILTQSGAQFTNFTGVMSATAGNSNGGTTQPRQQGAAGTVYKQSGNQSLGQGILIINNNNLETEGDVTTLMPTSVDLSTFSQILITNKGNLAINADDTLNLGTANIQGSGSGSAFVSIKNATGLSFPANYTLSGYTLNLDVPVTATSNITIARSGNLSHSVNNATHWYTLNLALTGNLTVPAGSAIDVTGKGYTKNNGPGAPVLSDDGAAHGGRGGDNAASTVAGTPYLRHTLE